MEDINLSVVVMMFRFPCPLSVTTKHNPYKLVHHDPTSVYVDKTFIIWMSTKEISLAFNGFVVEIVLIFYTR